MIAEGGAGHNFDYLVTSETSYLHIETVSHTQVGQLQLQKNRNYDYFAILGTFWSNQFQFGQKVIYFFYYFPITNYLVQVM